MITNISDKNITLRWDGREVVLKPKEKLDVRDLNVPQEQVALVEAKIGGKNEGLVKISHTKSELLGREDIRKQQEILDKEKAEFEKEKAEFAKKKDKK